MGFAMIVLRVVTVGPALLMGLVLTVVVCALLPDALGLVMFLIASGLLVALALGHLQVLAIVAFTGTRLATEAELHVMAPALNELGGRGVHVDALFVRRVQRSSTPLAVAIGPRSAVVSPSLVAATHRGDVTGAEAAATLAHAVGRRRALRPRLELAVLAATTPWRLLVGMFCGMGRAFDWLPLMRLAWTLRGVLGVICVMQSVAEGRAASGGLGGMVIALTYLVPAAGRRIEHRIEAEADRFVLDIGFDTVPAGLLRRHGQPLTLERAQRLEAAAPLPRLRLVRG